MLLKLRCFWETDRNIKISRTIFFTNFLGLRCFWETQPSLLLTNRVYNSRALSQYSPSLLHKYFVCTYEFHNIAQRQFVPIYIYIYAFSRRFYPKRLTVHSGYTFFISMCVPWELNPQPFALLTQCSTTEPQEHLF